MLSYTYFALHFLGLHARYSSFSVSFVKFHRSVADRLSRDSSRRIATPPWAAKLKGDEKRKQGVGIRSSTIAERSTSNFRSKSNAAMLRSCSMDQAEIQTKTCDTSKTTRSVSPSRTIRAKELTRERLNERHSSNRSSAKSFRAYPVFAWWIPVFARGSVAQLRAKSDSLGVHLFPENDAIKFTERISKAARRGNCSQRRASIERIENRSQRNSYVIPRESGTEQIGNEEDQNKRKFQHCWKKRN